MRFSRTIAIGILSFLALPASAHADALSPWVQEVIERSKAGVAMATSIYSGDCSNTVMVPEIEDNLSMVRDVINTTRDLAIESQFLRERTICFENDRRLLEDQMDVVRNTLTTAIQTCNTAATKALRDNYEFLAGAYESFLVGGDDPSFKDLRLKYTYPFHDLTLWQNRGQPVFNTGASVPICPFTTDFSPHSYGYVPTPGGVVIVLGPTADMKSYGCDRMALWHIPVALLWREADPQIVFGDRYQQFYESLYNLLVYTLPLLPGAQPGQTPPRAAATPPHAKIDGCLKPALPGAATGNGAPGPYDAAYFESILAAFPGYFDIENADPATGSFDPQPDAVLPIGMLLRNPYDNFLTWPNATILIRKLLDFHALVGFSRPLPGTMGQSSDNFFLWSTLQRQQPIAMRADTANMDQELGILDAWHRDAIGKSQEGVRPLTEAVQSLMDVVNKELPEKYIPDLTYFLMRSCVEGPCKDTLKNVMKRTFNPYCHPYVKGLYKEDDAHKKCLCDSSVDSGFLDKYCSEDYDASKYPKDGTLIPACQPEDQVTP
jgi:hypothetical protein